MMGKENDQDKKHGWRQTKIERRAERNCKERKILILGF
jgi:hypothetical protein